MPIDKIMWRFSASQIPELEKWIEEWALDWTIQTVCDVRRHVESILWVWQLTNDEIIDWVLKSWWFFTSRLESDTWDICFVNLDELISNLKWEEGQQVQ